MDIESTTTPSLTWESMMSDLTELNQQLAVAQEPESDVIMSAVVALQDELLDTPAPTLMAVVQKLEIMWEAEMHGLDQGSEEKRLVIEDLSQLIAETR